MAINADLLLDEGWSSAEVEERIDQTSLIVQCDEHGVFSLKANGVEIKKEPAQSGQHEKQKPSAQQIPVNFVDIERHPNNVGDMLALSNEYLRLNAALHAAIRNSNNQELTQSLTEIGEILCLYWQQLNACVAKISKPEPCNSRTCH